MKKTYFILLIILSLSALAAQNWGTINNTNHSYYLEKEGDDIYICSWGGVLKLQGAESLPFNELKELKHINTGEGIVSNDIYRLAKIEGSERLWLGSRNDGISIVSDAGVQNLNLELGLPSLSINAILEYGNTILVATTQGLASYSYLSGINFPLMLNQYTRYNTHDALLHDNVLEMHLTEDKLLYLNTEAGINYVHIDSLDVDSSWHKLGDDAAGLPPIIAPYCFSLNRDKMAIASSGRVFTKEISANTWQEIVLEREHIKDISQILMASDGMLWIANGRWDHSRFRYERDSDSLLVSVSPGDDIRYFRENEAGLGIASIANIQEYDGQIYLCTWGEGIARWEDDNWLVYNPVSIGFPRISFSYSDSRNDLWFSSGNIGHQMVPKGTLGVSRYNRSDWHTFNIHNSPLHSDNILQVTEDTQGRMWFGTWDSEPADNGWFNAVCIYDEADDKWLRLTKRGVQDYDLSGWVQYTDYLPNTPKILGNTVHGIHRDLHGNMLVLCYDDGVSVIAPDFTKIRDFTLKNSNSQRVLNAYHNGRQYFFGTEYDNGLSIWKHDSIPETDGALWETNMPPELNSGTIYGVASTKTPYAGWYHFIASGSGLYMWDEEDWYRYDINIKRLKYSFERNEWVNETLYYEDEERLWGSFTTVPNSIYGDPFGRIWVGSYDHGITMYDPVTERFTSYYKDNSPLLADRIISLGYDPLDGKLLIGTPDGLNTLRIGRSIKPNSQLNEVKAFPNPFYANGKSTVQLVNLPSDSMPKGKNECRIYSASGLLIQELKENLFSRFEWDGRNKAGNLVASGIYYFAIMDDKGNTMRGKLALIKQ
ncbi:MAG: two-component regulator propeller domain-containing protein [Candidatus Cloacimonetes bacterium]|nr:two-component regulator propeller domain-containing protein [Candidatus Cloacimonadota bacterium]